MNANTCRPIRPIALKSSEISFKSFMKRESVIALFILSNLDRFVSLFISTSISAIPSSGQGVDSLAMVQNFMHNRIGGIEIFLSERMRLYPAVKSASQSH